MSGKPVLTEYTHDVHESYKRWMDQVQERRAIEALSEFRTLVDNIGVEAILNKMDGDTFWKLYTFFKSREGDRG